MKNFIKVLRVTKNLRKAFLIHMYVKDGADKCTANYIFNNLDRFELFGMNDILVQQYNEFVTYVTICYWGEYANEYVVNPVQDDIYLSDTWDIEGLTAVH